MRRRTIATSVALVVALSLLAPTRAGGQQAPAEPGTPEAALAGITQLTAGGNHTCALMTSGQVRCWGQNYDGEIGTGQVNDPAQDVSVVLAPTEPGPLTGVVQVEAGTYHTCARLQNGQ